MVAKSMKSLSSYFTSLTNTFSVFLVGGMEFLVGNNIFQCPCEKDDLRLLYDIKVKPSNTHGEWRRIYCVAFIVWPATSAFFIALALSSNVLRCLIDHRCNHCDVKRHWRALQYLTASSTSVFVPPLAWLFIAFIDGRYYTCGVTRVPNRCLPNITKLHNVTLAANHALLTEENLWHRCVSQIVGLTVCGLGITSFALYRACSYLCSKTPYYKRRYIQLHREKEMETFSTNSEECLTRECGTRWKQVFQNPDAADWEALSALPTESPGELHHNFIHSDGEDKDKLVKKYKTKLPAIANGKTKVGPE